MPFSGVMLIDAAFSNFFVSYGKNRGGPMERSGVCRVLPFLLVGALSIV